jgi:long-subunit acyl-CoA synthetase (AMP-forming)
MNDDQGQPTLLHYLLQWERLIPDAIYLTQPRSGGIVVDYTWREVASQARRMAAHLQSMRLPARSSIAIFGKNSAHWIIADLAIWMAGHVSVPIYPSASSEMLAYVLEHSETRLLFVGKLDGDAAGWSAVRAAVPSHLPLINLPLSARRDAGNWSDIVAATPPLASFALPAGSELATIVYTSGSTGQPKGVMHSFGTMCAVPYSATHLVDGGARPTPADRMLSYLPLAHCAERQAVECTSLRFGFRLFFCERRETFAQDLRRASPTIFLSVPRLWIRLFQLIGRRIPLPVQRVAFALPWVSGLLKRRLLQMIGLGQVRTAYIGTAPVPASILGWYRSLGLEVLEAYGMTENFAYSHLNRPGQVRDGYVGLCHPGVQCRIASDGEILVKSPGQMLGYFKAAGHTADSYTLDGFFKTGDCGQIDDQGRLRITGRLKELFKTDKGKYVVPAPIETRLCNDPWIEAACVTGPGRTRPFALVMLSAQIGARLVSDGERTIVADRLERLLEQLNAQLESHERLGMLVVIRKPWSVASGDLTPTLKIRRAAIEDRHLWKADHFERFGQKVVFE